MLKNDNDAKIIEPILPVKDLNKDFDEKLREKLRENIDNPHP